MCMFLGPNQRFILPLTHIAFSTTQKYQISNNKGLKKEISNNINYTYT